MSKKQKGGENIMYFREDDDLDTGEWLPINAIPELTKQDDTRNPKQQTLRHLINTSSRFSYPHSVTNPSFFFGWFLAVTFATKLACS